MYTWLQRNERNEEIFCNLSLGIIRVFEKTQAEYTPNLHKRMDAIIAFCNKIKPTLPEDHVNTIKTNLVMLHPYYDMKFLDIMFHLHLAYFQQSAEFKENRTQRILKTASAYFLHPQPLKEHKGLLLDHAFVVPDELLDDEVTRVCARIAREVPQECEERKNRVANVLQKNDELSEKLRSIVRQDIADILCLFPAGDLEAFTVAVGKMVKQSNNVSDKYRLFTNQIIVDFRTVSSSGYPNLAATYRQLVNTKDIDAAALANTYLASLPKDAWQGVYTNFRHTLTALEKGLDLGEKGARTLELIAEKKKDAQTYVHKLYQKTLGDETKSLPAPSPGLDQDKTSSTPEQDAIWAWPVDKLLEYIGPLKRRPGKSQKSRSAKAETVETPLPGERTTTTTAPSITTTTTTTTTRTTSEQTSPSGPPLDYNTVQNGLAKAIDYYTMDITDALALADNLKIQDETTAYLQQHRTTLSGLKKEKVIDTTTLQSIAMDVEEGLQNLRALITSTQHKQQVAQDFPAALKKALQAEKLVYGKRHGGIVACPVNEGDWPAINTAYHNRYVSTAARIEVAEQDYILSPNEAIVLYVTYQSQSGYAFDISAHLWRRREDGGNEGPGLPSTDEFPPIDEENWHDTLIPCCVLHLPWSKS